MPYETEMHLKRLKDLLCDSGDAGMLTAEAAAQLGVSQQTIRNYLRRLESTGTPIYELEGNRYAIDPDYCGRNLYLSLAQAWLLYLPLRRIVRANLMNRSPLVVTLLRRIANLLHGEQAASLIKVGQAAEQPRDDILETLVEAWQEQRYVEIRYWRLDASSGVTHRVAPWWFEPAVWSDSNYLIAGRKGSDGEQPVPFKLDRIEWARKLDTRFERPPTEQLLQRIEESWGIWGSAEPVKLVRLRFHPRVRDRLNETRWHPTQQLTYGDNWVYWQAQIAEPQEMLPWIRGWGADVEVLEPEDIREQVASEAERTARLYGREPSGKRSFF